MKRATDRFDSEKLINAGFKVKPDLMWKLKSDNRYPMTVLERYNPKTRLFVAPAFSLALLIDAVPKFTTYGWFAIKYNLRADAYLVGYVDDEDNFTKVYGLANLIDAIVYLLLWTLENPEVVKEGEKYLGKEDENYSNREMHIFILKKEGSQVWEGECSFIKVREIGNRLALKHGKLQLLAYNRPKRRWEDMGTFNGGMRFTKDSNLYNIRPDYSGIDIVDKKGG